MSLVAASTPSIAAGISGPRVIKVLSAAVRRIDGAAGVRGLLRVALARSGPGIPDRKPDRERKDGGKDKRCRQPEWHCNSIGRTRAEDVGSLP